MKDHDKFLKVLHANCFKVLKNKGDSTYVDSHKKLISVETLVFYPLKIIKILIFSDILMFGDAIKYSLQNK